MQETLNQYKELLERVDAWFARCMELFPHQIACGSGCSHCCRSLFDITLLDAYYLKQGFDQLPQDVQDSVLAKCRDRVRGLQEVWQDFSYPYLLNYRPEEEWEELMPDEDETPCVLLGDDGRCLVYAHRAMTCRLHGLPLIDVSGEVMHDEWCTMNFTESDPLEVKELAAPFDEILHKEVALFRQFTERLLNKRLHQLDTFIPCALLIDFENVDWEEVVGRCVSDETD